MDTGSTPTSEDTNLSELIEKLCFLIRLLTLSDNEDHEALFVLYITGKHQ